MLPVGGETEELAFLCNATSIPAMSIGTTTLTSVDQYILIDRTFEP